MATEPLADSARDGGWVTVRWRGDIDMANATDLERRSLDLVENSDHGVSVDLSSVEYIDSAGIRVLVEMWRLLSERQQRLQIILPEHSVLRRGLEIGGITRMIATFSDEAAARDAR